MNAQETESVAAAREDEPRPLAGDGNGRIHHETDSVPGLFKKLALEISTLFSQELALAKSEMTSAVSDVRGGLTSMALGGSVLYAGILFLLGGVTILLTQWVTLMAAAFIVGAVVSIIGIIILMVGKSRMKADALKPDRTLHAVKKDAEFARRQAQ